MVMGEYAIIAISAVCGIVGGLILSKILFGTDKSKNSPQKINENEIRRWKINPDWSTILMAKDPSSSAENMLKKLMQRKEKNNQRKIELLKRMEDSLDELSEIRKRSSSMDSEAEKSLNVEIAISLWTSTISELRQEAEDCNAINVAHSYNKRFLDFVMNNIRKPALIGAMDSVSLDREFEMPFKKNLDLITATMKGMVAEDQDKINEFFNI